MEFFGANGHIKLNCYRLWIRTINGALPPFLIYYEISCRIFSVLTGDFIDSKFDLRHCCLFLNYNLELKLIILI